MCADEFGGAEGSKTTNSIGETDIVLVKDTLTKQSQTNMFNLRIIWITG